MKKLKIVTVVGTRPEIIRLSRVIAKLDQCMDHVLIHTGQNYDYELNEIFFNDLEIRKPDHFLGAAGATPVRWLTIPCPTCQTRWPGSSSATPTTSTELSGGDDRPCAS